MKQAVKCLNPLLKVNRRSRKGWRNGDDLFKDPAECPLSYPGTLDMSPAWFHQGHKAISVLIVRSIISLMTLVFP